MYAVPLLADCFYPPPLLVSHMMGHVSGGFLDLREMPGRQLSRIDGRKRSKQVLCLDDSQLSGEGLARAAAI